MCHVFIGQVGPTPITQQKHLKPLHQLEFEPPTTWAKQQTMNVLYNIYIYTF